MAEATWLALNVVSGGGSATNSQPIGVTKIAKSVIAPLADHNISVFMLSTYQTDFILVSAACSFAFLNSCTEQRQDIGLLKEIMFTDCHHDSTANY